MKESEKYKQFRNFMTNELGITRQDIEAWTKQSVATEVEKLIGQINVQELVESSIDKAAHFAIQGGRYGGGQNLRDELAKLLSQRITVTIDKEK